jgi:xylulokinase
MSLLGIDIGTTGAKVILLEEDGYISANVTEEYDTSTPHPLWSEQAPGLWWDATCAACKQALATSVKSSSEITGVGADGRSRAAG